MKLFFSLVLIFVSLLGTVSAQNLKLTGTIKDAKDNSLLIGASVSIAPSKDTTNISGTLTDMKGSFAFYNLKKGTYLIKVSYIGYEHLVRYFKSQ